VQITGQAHGRLSTTHCDNMCYHKKKKKPPKKEIWDRIKKIGEKNWELSKNLSFM